MISFSGSFAKKFGVIEAIIFNKIIELLNINQTYFQNFHNNKFWVDFNYHTYRNYFYFITEYDLNFALENLVKQNILESLTLNNSYLFTITDFAKEKHSLCILNK